MHRDMLDRFFRYIKIDTQSREDVQDQYPSTEKQKNLSRLLLDELKKLGLKYAEMDKHGYVTATFPSNLPKEKAVKVPVIGFLGHMDTSPEVSGKNVKPVIHENYQGGDIVLPGDTSKIIKIEENPELKNNQGNDIVTSDGTTLLGADDKAGIAEIMTMLDFLKKHPEIPHGTSRIGFTLDEEVGNGTKYFDVKKFGADFAYTVDGEKVGGIENETFNASHAVFTVYGINVHPGYAKDKLVNAIRILSDILREMENEPAPETTEKKEGYLHPYVIQGGVEKAVLKVLIRDFELKGVEKKESRLRTIQKRVTKKYPRAKIELEVKEQYKNMRSQFDEDSRITEYALEAVRRTGIEPKLQSIRGGSDAANLCYKGLLTANIFTGGMNFHSKLEWIPVQAMEKAVETLVNLIQIWVEKSL